MRWLSGTASPVEALLWTRPTSCAKKHDRLAEKLISARMEEAPVGCVRLTLKQIEMADKKFWTLMAEKTRDGIKASAAGRPCDVHFGVWTVHSF